MRRLSGPQMEQLMFGTPGGKELLERSLQVAREGL
jgi:hypothetical protein